MADIISRLKLESGEFDSKIKRASQELTAYSQHCRKMGLEMGYANKDAKEFAKSLGSMQTTATTARGKVSELSDAFVNLKAMYNQMTDAEKQGQFGKNLAASLDQLKQRTQQAKQELADITKELSGASNIGGGGGLFSSDKLSGMLQVFGGNLMTKGLELATGAVSSLASEIGGMITQGVELAKQGDGIRIAFQRLGRGDILQGLREATHGTVTDLELMKAAVKFNDFKLPVEELGTMLAFAQQKAKDTGQSVDYMVDSIVTGLGRKSLMILDNLGLSATEIRERMKETGDMTKAVGDIIREQMAKAGDYVETAADRAAQANVSLQNKMEELGRKFAPLEEASNQFWTSMKIGILDIIGGPITTMLNELTEAGRIMNQLKNMNGGGEGKESRTDKALRMLREYSGGKRGIEGKRDLYNRQVASFSQQENKAWREVERLRKERDAFKKEARERGAREDDIYTVNDYDKRIEQASNRAKAIQIARSQYEQGGKQYLDSLTVDVNVDTNKAIKGISDLKKQLKELEAQRNKAVLAGDDEQVELLTKQINTTKQKIGYLDPNALKTSGKTEKTEIQKNEDQIKKLSLEYAKLGDVETEASRKRQEEIKKEIELLQQRNGLLGLRMEQAQGRLLPSSGDFDKNTKNVGGIGLLDQATNFGGDIAIPSGGLQLSDKAMDAVNKSLNNQKKDVKGVADEWMSVTSAIQSVSTAMASIEDPAAKVLGIVAQAIATVALTFSKSLKGTVTPWDWIAAAAAGTATMISTIAAIHSATGYAEGGMIKGNSYSGDNLMAMGPNGLIGLNAGEIVLNKSQQNNIASQLQGNPMGGMNLTATIRGEQIRLALNNNGRRTGRGEYVQSRNVR